MAENGRKGMGSDGRHNVFRTRAVRDVQGSVMVVRSDHVQYDNETTEMRCGNWKSFRKTFSFFNLDGKRIN